MVNDPTSDLLNRIRNGLRADHEAIEMPASKFNVEVARILSEQGFVESYGVEPARVGQTLRVKLKYTESRKPVITGMKRISKPGRREYVGAKEIPRVLGGMGLAIISTSKGVMTGHDASREGVGGEVVAFVW